MSNEAPLIAPLFLAELTSEILGEYRSAFYADPKNALAQNLAVKGDPVDAATSRTVFQTVNHVYSHKVVELMKNCNNSKENISNEITHFHPCLTLHANKFHSIQFIQL